MTPWLLSILDIFDVSKRFGTDMVLPWWAVV